MQRERYCPYCAGRLSERIRDGRQRLCCERCRKTLDKHPLPATCVVAMDNRQRILLVKRSATPETGHWFLPGGFMEPGESPEQAALRELEEQTGLRGKIETLLGVTTAPADAIESILMIGYLVTQVTGVPTAGSHISAPAWFHPADHPPVAFTSHRHFIRMVVAAHID